MEVKRWNGIGPEAGAGAGCGERPAAPAAPRLRRLARAEVLGTLFPVARGARARLLGLALLERRDAGSGLLIPRCRSVHTFGMRFALDVVFLGRYGEPIAVRRGVRPRRVVWHRGASAVLELPARGAGGGAGEDETDQDEKEEERCCPR